MSAKSKIWRASFVNCHQSSDIKSRMLTVSETNACKYFVALLVKVFRTKGIATLLVARHSLRDVWTAEDSVRTVKQKVL